MEDTGKGAVGHHQAEVSIYDAGMGLEMRASAQCSQVLWSFSTAASGCALSVPVSRMTRSPGPPIATQGPRTRAPMNP